MQTKTRQPICLARVRKSQATVAAGSLHTTPKQCESPAPNDPLVSYRTTMLETREPLNQVMTQRMQLISQKQQPTKLVVNKTIQNLNASKTTQKTNNIKVMKKKNMEYNTPKNQKNSVSIFQSISSVAPIYFKQQIKNKTFQAENVNLCQQNKKCQQNLQMQIQKKCQNEKNIQIQLNKKIQEQKFIIKSSQKLQQQINVQKMKSQQKKFLQKIHKNEEKLKAEIHLLIQDRQERNRVWQLMQNDLKICRAQLSVKMKEKQSLIKTAQLLQEKNQKMQEKLCFQEKQKIKLIKRIQYLENELDSLSLECQLSIPNFLLEGEQVEKSKNLRNQFQLERIKRANLQRQIQMMKCNQEIQLQRERQRYQKSNEQLKDKYQKKCQQVKEKENILRSFIV